jgi:hypothetical protein
VAAQLIGYGFFHGRVQALNSVSDGGLFGLVGNISIAAAALAAWVVFIRVRPATIAILVLLPLLTFLAIDKVFRLNDHIPDWLVFYLPVLAVTLLPPPPAARHLPHGRHQAGIATSSSTKSGSAPRDWEVIA